MSWKPRFEWNTILLPSGDQFVSEYPRSSPLSDVQPIWVRPVPSMFVVHTPPSSNCGFGATVSQRPSIANAILSPAGDQVGLSLKNPARADGICCCPVPSANIVQVSPPRVKAILLPSADHEGVYSGAALFVRFTWFVPSGFIVQMSPARTNAIL